MQNHTYKIIVDIRVIFNITDDSNVIKSWLYKLFDEQLNITSYLNPSIIKSIQKLYINDYDGYLYMLEKIIYDIITSIIQNRHVYSINIEINNKVRVAIMTLKTD